MSITTQNFNFFCTKSPVFTQRFLSMLGYITNFFPFFCSAISENFLSDMFVFIAISAIIFSSPYNIVDSLPYS